MRRKHASTQMPPHAPTYDRYRILQLCCEPRAYLGCRCCRIKCSVAPPPVRLPNRQFGHWSLLHILHPQLKVRRYLNQESMTAYYRVTTAFQPTVHKREWRYFTDSSALVSHFPRSQRKACPIEKLRNSLVLSCRHSQNIPSRSRAS